MIMTNKKYKSKRTQERFDLVLENKKLLNSKICSECKIEKHLNNFHKHKSGCKFGLRAKCKECRNKENKKYKENNKQYYKEYKKKYGTENHNSIKYKSKVYWEKNKEKLNIKQKLYRSSIKGKMTRKKWEQDNKEHLKEYQKEYKKNNKHKKKKWKQDTRDKRLEVERKWRDKNRDEIRNKSKKYYHKKIKTSPLSKLKITLRNRTYAAFKRRRWNKNSSNSKLLGCSYETAKKHIERQFTKGMTWDNHGEWHIDHKYPLSLATTEEELIKLCHYRNLQPLWSKDNLEKSNKILNVQIQFKI